MQKERESESSIAKATPETKGGPEPKNNTVFDPFDPENLKLTDADRADMGVTPVLVELPARKPGRQEWIRTDPDRWVETILFKLEDSGEFYLVGGNMRLSPDLFETAKPFRVQLATNRAGSPFLWPAQIPEDGGAGASWHRSAQNCQLLAEKGWIRVVSDRHAGSYVPRTTAAKLPDPKWPDMSMRDMLELCFGARVIDDEDHPVLKMLRGAE